ncbi:beta-N-acetylhexosaminidase [Amycolatopsis sp. PS_44_ISF1]|uniref:beta-N-acetylhexosaminidase n=1 Tax=Amycolatopsis sp. PS_44_ISF1 TaxID=2974917 RepID=UPI0028DD86CA|nr:beta-N-acetylhexosaminidase [Amycolatopsis sp. PS_44_ISF1]MDT8915078.1 beta-N-acetylhexosaminidase [Amycolatopsis sp. PS_44_ISF1]
MPGFDTLLPRPVSVSPAPGTCPWPVAVSVRAGPELPAEGYRLDITPDGVTLSASDSAGEVHGRETLRQLAGPDAFRAAPIHSGLTLPCGVVRDHPRHGWRGCLLDVARHFRTKAEVLRFVDLLAAHKLNVLNLHLTDDQGWRIEVPRYPRLTSVGGWRHGSAVGRHDGPERDGRPHGGFYTTDDLREIVAYAAARAVTVVPEIDVPGHSRAAIAAYPELGPEPEAQWEVWTAWGVSTSLLDPSESTRAFYRAVFDHLLDIFPSPVIALGGDETPGRTEAHGRFVRDLAAYLVSRGRRPMGWDEVLDIDGLPPMLIGAWQSDAAGQRAAHLGHDVVLCSEEHLYLDHRQSDHPDEPIPVGYLHTLADVYGYEPALAGPRLRGVQAQIWAEHLDTVRRVDYAAFPRLAAFAELAWSPPGRDFAEFLPRLRDHHLPRLDALGVEYRPLDGPHPWQTRPDAPGRPR